MGRKPVNFICTVEGCENQATRKGLCKMHYSRVWRHGDTNKLPSGVQKSEEVKTCSVKECNNPHSCNGLCQMHYMRLRRNTDLD